MVVVVRNNPHTVLAHLEHPLWIVGCGFNLHIDYSCAGIHTSGKQFQLPARSAVEATSVLAAGDNYPCVRPSAPKVTYHTRSIMRISETLQAKFKQRLSLRCFRMGKTQ